MEDEAITALETQSTVEEMGYEVVGIVNSGTEAIDKVKHGDVDLILMDIRLEGGMDGIKAAKKIKQEVDLPVIYVTAHSESETLDRAKESEAAGFILKPFTRKDLNESIETVMSF